MAVYNKFNQFTKDVIEAKHNFASDVFKVLLTATDPLATNTVRANLVEIGAGNGYIAGGAVAVISVSITGGTTKVSAADASFIASGGSIGPFRYAALYNSTQASQPLVSWWDYGDAISLASLEEFRVRFDVADGIFQIT